jgi:hypothetical protein
MDETTYRILDTLWRETGRPISIHELTSRIRSSHGTAYYPNIYDKTHELATDGTISLTKAGRSSLANLNFANYLLIDLLTELEIKRKHDLLTKSKELQMLFKDAEERCEDIRSIESISAISTERNLKLNRAEMLFLLHDTKNNLLRSDIMSIHAIAMRLQALHAIRIDPLILTTNEFIEFLTSDEINPLKEMLYDKISFHAPQDFWSHIASALAKGYRIGLLDTETNPARIAEKDLTFNLARFGYKEIGPQIREGQRICIEYIIVALMRNVDARRIEAIPILLAKNRANYSLLIFLSQKYGLSGRLIGLLKALNRITPSEENAMAIEILESMKTKEIKANNKSIEERMRLYGATGQQDTARLSR